MLKTPPTTVAAYITTSAAWARDTLKELRKTIKVAAPKAKESMSYHIPYYSHNGRLAYFAAFKNHCSFFWISSLDKKKFAKDLAKRKAVGRTLQIQRGERVPTALIKKIVRERVRSNAAK